MGIFSEKYWLSEFDFNNSNKTPLFPIESVSVLRERIGVLKYGRDEWYTIDSHKSAWTLVDGIKEDLIQYALPFFEAFNSSPKIINHLKSNLSEAGYTYRLFIMLAEEGRLAEAEKVYQKLWQNCAQNQTNFIKEKGDKYNFKRPTDSC